MKHKIHMTLMIMSIAAGGYFHGFIYYPKRWPGLVRPEVFELSAVLIGMFLGCMGYWLLWAIWMGFQE